MIFYDPMCEEWVDSEDDTFRVDMTPEGTETEREFLSQDEFFRWYNEL